MVAAEKAVKADARDAKVKAKLRAAAKARAKAEAIADATAEATIASLRIPPSTYQEHAAANSPSFFPELAPAPFPQDIHSCMPYTNRTTKTGLIQGGSQSHNDLESFEGMEHNMDSTIYRGTLFEYQTQEILRNCLGIYTQRSAGNNDLGVDLRGTWFIPLSVSPRPGDLVRHLKVIVQCKRMNSNIGPKFVRELQGSLSYESQPTMALLAVSTNFTKQALKPYAKSLWPMCLVVIDTEKKECKELMWNRAAEKVMHGLQIGTAQSICERGKLRNRPVLCFNGHVVRRLPGPYLNDTLVPSTSSTSPEPLAETAFASTVVKDKSLEILGQERHVNYAIPDWNIATQPEYLYVVPEATRSIAISEDSSEDPDHHPPLSSSHVELLTWSPSPHIQTSVDTILDSSSNDLY
ncbi:hypothetical protein BGZ83_001666 [Gryganskiella cystojenkinii]|nr:hypothetical protein BGZ83_001666 [Gryganskiella cystojenkinii]